MARVAVVFCLAISAVSALPTDVISRLSQHPRYQYVDSSSGARLVDSWLTVGGVREAARFVPDSQIVYHLFTRLNPVVSQPLLTGLEGLLGLTNYDARRRTIVIAHGWLDDAMSDVNCVLVQGLNPVVSQPLLTGVEGLLGLTNYDARRRTIVIAHGWLDDAMSDVNSVLVPAFLSAEDVNVIVVDWSAGASTINYLAAVANTITAGESVARFLSWLINATNGTPLSYHLVGHSLGGHLVGVTGRNLAGEVAYITSLDPMFTLWNTHSDKLRSTDARYTEVIHTNAGRLGYLATLGDADFYPNGGSNMPGCDDQDCDHHRSFYYLAESLISGGFTGTRCLSYITALTGNCGLWGSLHMGGLVPKIGSSGVFWLQTNAEPPFSQG